MKKQFFCILSIVFCMPIFAQQKQYSLWYDKPAPNRGGIDKVISGGFPYDEDWEKWSLPIGNGYMGASVFGRTDTERIQISEKTFGNKGTYKFGGVGNFAEILLDLNHSNISNYRRELRLNDAISTVHYQCQGVNYSRTYFADYPSNVIVVKLTADQPGKISFLLHPKLPYLRDYNDEKTGRTGKVTAANNLITMEGRIQFYDLPYEAQLMVIPTGGQLISKNDTNGEQGQIEVKQADSVILIINAQTAYQLKSSVFTELPENKFKGNEHPHNAVSKCILAAAAKGYDKLYKEHLEDYKSLFDRVQLHLTDNVAPIPTDSLLHNCKKGQSSLYMDELLFQYGRYLLIASSRKGSLPAHLQGAWSQYDYAPWSGGYWHNVNVQMNYWPAFNTNLAELFVPYMEYNEAYRLAAQKIATQYIQKNNPESLSSTPSENGWTIGTGATAYYIGAPGGHSGPGTGGFTTKLYWDYYDFTRDKVILKEHTYPAILGMAQFLSKTLTKDSLGHLLVEHSASPEQKITSEDPKKKIYYSTKGCTFDQGMIWENNNDLLNAASILNIKNSFLESIKIQQTKLDPILVGESGQIKEFREEKKYGEIGDPKHRHISHLCTLYPGTLINSGTPDWMKAATYTLNQRGDKSNGWSMAHRLNLWARVKDGDRAYKLYQQLQKDGILENLWDNCPPFQIDGNFGATSGVAEMLLQSHEGYIEPLAALPKAWATGNYSGLVARGNFVIGVNWKLQKLIGMDILSRAGEVCKIKYTGIEKATILNSKGEKVKTKSKEPNMIQFATSRNESYSILFK